MGTAKLFAVGTPHRRGVGGHAIRDCGYPRFKLVRLKLKLRFADLACAAGKSRHGETAS
jgi:hypothetical protein